MSRGVDYPDRPMSEQMVDLHVFVVPPELWRDHLKSAVNQIINDTVSAGFLRVFPEAHVHALREEIEAQLGFDVVPREYVFLRSVGRALTRIKPKQERMLKVKAFLPPQAYSPEIYLLESTPEVRNIPFSGTSSEFSNPSYRNGYDNYESGRGSERSEFGHKPVVPPIRPGGGNAATTQTDDEGSDTPRFDRYPMSPPTNTSATQTGNNTPVPTPRSRTPARRYSPIPPIGQTYRGTNPPRDLIPPRRESPSPGRSRSPSRTDPKDHPPDQRAPTPAQRRSPAGAQNPRRTPTPERRIRNRSPSPRSKSPQQQSPRSRSPRSQSPRQQSHRQQSPRQQSPRQQSPREQSPRSQSSRPRSQSPHPQSPRSGSPQPQSSQSPQQEAHAPPPNANGHNANGSVPAGDSPLPPLSASPAGSSPRPGQDNQSQRLGSQADDGEFLPPVSATPPHSPGHPSQSRRPGDHSNGSDGQHNPDGADDRERRRLEELLRKEREDEERRRAAAESDEADRRRRQWEEEEKRRKEEERQRDRHGGGRREDGDGDDDEERRQAEEERRRREEEQYMRQPTDGFRSPPPPPPREESVDAAAEKTRILAELEKVREERRDMEKKREELVKKAKSLQAKTHHKRNQARDSWKKKYFEEKKKTPPLEEQCNKLRQELDSLHRRIMSTLEGTKENRSLGGNKPSQQSNLKIQATKLQHDIEDFQRRVENVKMKLTSEMKLRNQAETELRALRAELTQKKIGVTLTRSQPYNAALSSGSQDFSSPRSNATLLTPKT